MQVKADKTVPKKKFAVLSSYNIRLLPYQVNSQQKQATLEFNSRKGSHNNDQK
jgi:hypothetical protein